MRSDLLHEAVDAWRDARHGVIEELENLGLDRFSERPVAGSRSVGELAIHILEVSEMMVEELTRPESDFTRKSFPELLQDAAADVRSLQEPREIMDALHRTLSRGSERLLATGSGHILGDVTQFDGTLASRLSWLYHGIAQEMYHRGQLALYARILGVEPALTRKIRELG